jgi:hypothetical protein
MPEVAAIAHALYGDFFERGVRYFFPDADVRVESRDTEMRTALGVETLTDGTVRLEWMGVRYLLARPGRPFTENQLRLLGAIGAVLSTRFRIIFEGGSAIASRFFEGLPEDRYVSAFLRLAPYLKPDLPAPGTDVVANAIEVMRESSLLTYENRRIATGVVLLGPEASRLVPPLPADAMHYSSELVGIKSFHRLCDGLHTVFLVNQDGILANLVDVRGFAGHGGRLPAPSSARYHAHSLASLRGGNICMVLTPNGEIKIFAGGVQMFSFLEGRWRLSDVTEKYHEFHQAVGSAALAERLFTAALNMVEHRRGGLFVVLDDAAAAGSLVAPDDLLSAEPVNATNKGRIHYLLRDQPVMGVELSVLQSIARVDGGLVMDRAGRLLAFGAILRHIGEELGAQEGGRTTAAVHSSRFGVVLKISEDGGISFYRNAEKIWEL